MNIQESDIMMSLIKTDFVNQRILSENTGYSLGVINRSINNLKAEGYLDNQVRLTDKALTEIQARSPKNAIILSAGLGVRMVPVNLSIPKGLLEINGEKLIERLIKQLHSAGITDITIVVGFLKESFEYLIDEYGVDLVVNEEYASKNNLHSLSLVYDRIKNTYIVPCDIWCSSNPFSSIEMYSWYLVSEDTDEESLVRINRKKELVKVLKNEDGNRMIGISYIAEPESHFVRKNLQKMDDHQHSDSFWEDVLFYKDRMIIHGRVSSGSEFVEINTYEQLREKDSNSNHLKSDSLNTIASVLNCKVQDIVNIYVLKKGMTNRSFIFCVNNDKYIMRIPGEGTDKIINREHEAEVYRTISGMGLCDDPVYFNSENGYKITKYLDGIRVCNKDSISDLEKCMSKLRCFHEMKLKVNHTFDLFRQIDFYEELWEGSPSVFRDYLETKAKVLSLKSYIDSVKEDYYLTHIDAVPDNFLFYQTMNGEDLQLTDWEYSGMQDPHVDIAMFCIYSLYDKNHCDRIIDIYFRGECSNIIRAKIYCYISICGLLWSNWCEYKRSLGVEFGEYSLRQYRYAKDFYLFAKELIEDK